MLHGENIVASGPLYKSSKVEENYIIISFTGSGSGLMTNDRKELSEFAIAGADRKFVWAKVKIEGDKVMVSGDEFS